MNELACVRDVVQDDVPGLALDVVPSNPKDLLDHKVEIPAVTSPAGRKPYVTPRVEDLGSVESTTFLASVIMR